MAEEKKMMTTKEASEYLSVSEQTLLGWRRSNMGPPWVRIGARPDGGRGCIRYRVKELEEYLDSCSEGPAMAKK